MDIKFCEKIQKRVRKEIRMHDLFKKGDTILIIDDDSVFSKVNQVILKESIQGLPVKIVIQKKRYTLGENISSKYNKIVIPWSIEKEDSYFLECILSGKKPNYTGHFFIGSTQYVKLLVDVKEEEILEYALIR